jgi:phage/conjugal plasmid C-4 type zinc finger TraR family protein
MKGLEPLLNNGERMTEDECSQHAEQLHNDLALLQHRQRAAIDPRAESADWCDACGGEIPEARRKAVPGCKMCVDCAREQETKERMYR